MCIGILCSACSVIGTGLCCVGTHTSRLMKKDVKMGYGLLILFFSSFLMLILYFGSRYLHFAGKFINCPNDESLDSCLGLSSVYRLSFVLAIFHLIVLLCCLTRDSFAKIVNEGLWGFKLILILAGFIGMLFVSNNFFEPYAKSSMYISGIFLFVQAVCLIDAFYLWAQFWAKKYDDGNNCYGCLLIFTSLLMYSVAGYFIFSGFKHFWISGCIGNITILIFAVIFTLAFVVLIVLKFHPNGSIITSGAISIFGVYLFWSALISNPSDKCNPQRNNRWFMLMQILFSFFFAFSCNIYWALVTQKSTAYEAAKLPQISSSEGDEEVDKKIEAEQEEAKTKEGAQTNLIRNDGKEKEFEEYENNSYIKFHGLMFLFSIYICAVFSNWGYAAITDKTYNYEGSDSSAPYYIKIFIAFFTFSLYLWTVIAPTVFPDRDFNT